jgi:preprotein translocase subunit SecA
MTCPVLSLTRLFSFNERELARYRRTVGQVNALEERMRSLTDDQLSALTLNLRERLSGGDSLDDLLPEAYAAAREAARRVLGQRPFDVQVMGAIALHEGRIAEMKTGEGKTLAATMPLYLNALGGRGTHLVTTNDYLVKWQAEWMGPVYRLLGLTVGFIQHGMGSGDRAKAYACDVTYVRNSELGFDYLRDNMAPSADHIVLRDLHYAIVDEVDSILIDEARTPLILSGIPRAPGELYQHVNEVIAGLSPGSREEDGTEHGDYVVDEKMHAVHLTEQGQTTVERALGLTNIADPDALELRHHVRAALQAHGLYDRDKEYIVKDDEVIIVDEYTGHIQPGRRYSYGIHEAIEAKEGVPIRSEHQTVATITYQNFFRLYEKLAGMTGTAKTEEAEFQKIYGMPVIVIPTNRPMIREDLPDLIYRAEEPKFRAIVAEVIRCTTLGRPVLVGTRNVAVSELIARRLRRDRAQLLALAAILQDQLASRDDSGDADWEEWMQTLRLPVDEMMPPRPKEGGALEDGAADAGLPAGGTQGARRILTLSAAARIAEGLGVDPDVTVPENIRRLLRIWDIASDDMPPEQNSALEARLREVLQEDRQIEPLNAKNHEREADVIREAGRAAAITIATNMAGRGVDIRLGGEPPTGEDRTREYEEVKERGGLHVIGTERHESRRIDNQLRGRSGRQGDPGSSRFYVSLEDELLRVFAPERERFLTPDWPDEQPAQSRGMLGMLDRAQEKVETRNFGYRTHTLQYDDVMNVQRSVIYGNRRRVLLGEDVLDSVLGMIDRAIETVIDAHIDEEQAPEEWDLEGACRALDQIMPGIVAAGAGVAPDATGAEGAGVSQEVLDLAGQALLSAPPDELTDEVGDWARSLLEAREQALGADVMRQLEREALLSAIDTNWADHLQAIEALREGAYLKAYGQWNALVQYQKDAYDCFEELMDRVAQDVARIICAATVVTDGPEPDGGLSSAPTYEGETTA